MSLDRVQKTGPIFDTQKLDWMNGVYIRNLTPEDLKERLQPFLPSDFPHDKYEVIIPLVFERLVTLKDVEELTAFFYRDIEIDPVLLQKKSTSEEVKTQLYELEQTLERISDWTASVLEENIRSLQEKHDYKKKQYFMMIRVAVTGKQATPPLFETMEIIGKDVVLQRIHTSLHLLDT